MTDPVLIAREFALDFEPATANAVPHGHIHDTFVVSGGSGFTARVVLQRLNRSVFHDLDGLAANRARVTEHLTRRALARGERAVVAEPVPTLTGAWFHVDAAGDAWRIDRFVEGSRPLGPDATPTGLRAAAHAFARLTADLDDVGPLVDTIPRFHDLPRRRTDLAAAIVADRAGRVAGSGAVIAAAQELGERIEAHLAVARADDLPKRVLHNDAKLDNVLVDSGTGAVLAIVDLDTVMHGTVLNDFGELVRTAASTAPEDEPDIERVELEPERVVALAEGYLTGAQPFISDAEIACLPLAGPYLTIENATRFLTDHLDGDVYFRVHRPDHNAQRARVQLRLAELMVDRLGEIRTAITSVAEQAARP